MSAFTEFLVKILLPTIEQLGEGKLVELFQKFHDQNPEQYDVSIRAGHVFIKPLMDLVAGTATTIDDGFVAAINEAITMSAAANGIVFDAPPVI